MTKPLIAVVSMMVVGCNPPASLSARNRLRVLNESIEVGELVEIKIEGPGGKALSNQIALLEKVQVEPEGLLEKESPGQYRAIAAGMARFSLSVSAHEGALENTVSIACPAPTTPITVHEGGTLEGEVEWGGSSAVHRVLGPISLAAGARLTIGACTRVELASGAYFEVGEAGPAAIFVRGSPEHPIELRGIEAEDSTRALWGGIRIYADNAAGSSLRWLLLRDVEGRALEGESELAALDIVGSGFSATSALPFDLSNVDIEGCAGIGFRLRDVVVTRNVHWQGNRVTGCTSFPVSVDPVSISASPRGTFVGNGRDEIEVIGGSAGRFYQVWEDLGLPYRVRGTITIANQYPDGTSDLEHDFVGKTAYYVVVRAGVTFKFEQPLDPMAPRFGIVVGQLTESLESPPLSFLKIQGTRVQPVVFTSAAETPAPGDWMGIVLTQGGLRTEGSWLGSSSYFDHAVVEYAGGPTGLLSSSGEEARGGIVLYREGTYQLISGGLSPRWLLEGSLLTCNAGYGLFAENRTLKSVTDYISRRLGIESCICDNVVADFGPPIEGNPPLPTSACPCSAELHGWPDWEAACEF